MAKRTVSHPEAEKVIVAALLQQPRRLNDIKSFDRDMFSLPEVRLIRDAATQHHRRALDVGKVRYATRRGIEVILEQTLSTKGADKDATARRAILLQACRTLIDNCLGRDAVTEDEFKEALDDVRQAATDDRAKRGIIALAEKYESSGSEGMTRELLSLASSLSSTGVTNAGSVKSGVTSALARYERAKSNPNANVIPTPFPRLNTVTGGGRLGTLWLVAAFAKEGKTQLAKELVYHAGAECGKRCLIVTCEQTDDDVVDMMLVRHSHKFIPGGIHHRKFTDGLLSPEHEKVMRRTVASVEAGEMGDVHYWQSPYGTTVADIREYAEHLSRFKPVDVVMADHTGLFSPSRRTGSEIGDAAAVLRELKHVALTLNDGRGCWMLAPQQVNRVGYEAACKRGYYLPFDMAQTAETERSADVMLWILRTQELRDAREARIGVGFDRRGSGEINGWEILERLDYAALLPLAP